MTTRPPGPAARGLLAFMQASAGRLRALLDEEAAAAAGDLGPAGDAAVRAHLRFVAEALAANAAPATRRTLEAFARELPARLAERESLLDEELREVGEGAAFEVERQFGEGAGDDPSVQAMIVRRVRIAAWIRVFLAALDAARAPADPIAPAALAWMSERQSTLADTIFAMDRRAKEQELARGGPDAIAHTEVVNRIGQAATLQAHTKFLVEALAATLSGDSVSRPTGGAG